MSDFKVNCTWQGLELTIYAHVRDGDNGPCAYSLKCKHGPDGDGAETVVGMCEDDSDSIFIGWMGPEGDCNWFYSDSEDAHKIMQGLDKVLNREH